LHCGVKKGRIEWGGGKKGEEPLTGANACGPGVSRRDKRPLFTVLSRKIRKEKKGKSKKGAIQRNQKKRKRILTFRDLVRGGKKCRKERVRRTNTGKHPSDSHKILIQGRGGG